MSHAPRLVTFTLLSLLPAGLAAQADTLPAPVITTPVPDSSPSARSLARQGVLVGTAATVLPIAVGLAGASAMSEQDDSPVPLLLIVGGLVVGPAIGDWSAGLIGRGFSGIALRGLLGGGAAVGALAVGWECTDSCGAAVGLLIVSGGFMLSHAIWDIATLPQAVEKRRQRAVTVMPVYVPATGTPGLGLHVTF